MSDDTPGDEKETQRGTDEGRPISNRLLGQDWVKELMAQIEARDAWRRESMPDEQTAITILFEAFQRLKELGWKEAQYAPRDSRTLELIEAGSTGVHRGHCRERPASDFPATWFWIEDGDLYPSKPILFREPNSK